MPRGNVAMPFNTEGVPRAIDKDGKIQIEIFQRAGRGSNAAAAQGDVTGAFARPAPGSGIIPGLFG